MATFPLSQLVATISASIRAMRVQIIGSSLDRRGLAADQPLATAVDPGTTYWSVDTDPSGEAIEVSDGTTWTVM